MTITDEQLDEILADLKRKILAIVDEMHCADCVTKAKEAITNI